MTRDPEQSSASPPKAPFPIFSDFPNKILPTRTSQSSPKTAANNPATIFSPTDGLNLFAELVNIAAELVLVVSVGLVPCDITLAMVEFEDSDKLVIEGSDAVLNSVKIEEGSDFAHGR